MKTITTLLSIIILISLFGCATAGETKQQSPNDTEARIHAEISKLEKPIADATKALEEKPEWQEFMRIKADYADKAKEVVKMPEYKRLQQLENSRAYLTRLLEGGK